MIVDSMIGFNGNNSLQFCHMNRFENRSIHAFECRISSKRTRNIPRAFQQRNIIHRADSASRLIFRRLH